MIAMSNDPYRANDPPPPEPEPPPEEEPPIPSKELEARYRALVGDEESPVARGLKRGVLLVLVLISAAFFAQTCRANRAGCGAEPPPARAP